MNPSFYIPPLGPITKKMLILVGSFFILQTLLTALGSGKIITFLTLETSSVLSGQIYRLVTYPFVSHGLFSLIFDALIIWFFGYDLERKLGPTKYIKFLFFTLIVGGISFVLLSFLLDPSLKSNTNEIFGLSGFCFTYLMVYSIMYKDRVLTFMLIFPMKARYFCLLILGIELYMGLFSPMGVMAFGNLLIMAVGLLYLKFQHGLKIGVEHFLNKFYSDLKSKTIKKSKKPNLYIVKDSDKYSESKKDKDPKYWQ